MGTQKDEIAEKPCRIVGPYYPTGHIDWECRTHDVLAELRDPSKFGGVVRREDFICPVGTRTSPEGSDR